MNTETELEKKSIWLRGGEHIIKKAGYLIKVWKKGDGFNVRKLQQIIIEYKDRNLFFCEETRSRDF